MISIVARDFDCRSLFLVNLGISNVARDKIMFSISSTGWCYVHYATKLITVDPQADSTIQHFAVRPIVLGCKLSSRAVIAATL